ncbi:MAG: LamB/YcsF family protein [Cyanobacteria bacterium P01_H01_bin.74]
MPQPIDLSKKTILDPRVRHFLDLNTDLAQTADLDFFLQTDYALLNYVTSVNLPCAVHDGDPVQIIKAIEIAKQFNCPIGAHIGYPDPENQGYKAHNLDEETLSAWIYLQLGALQALAHAAQTEIAHVRPHGALYQAFIDNEAVAVCVAKAIKKQNNWLPLVAPAGAVLDAVQDKTGLRTVPEVYLGKRYTDQGQPVLSSSGKAFLPFQACIAQAKQLVDAGEVLSESGQAVKIANKTIHISPKMPQAIELAKKLNQLLIQPVSLPLADIGASGWL